MDPKETVRLFAEAVRLGTQLLSQRERGEYNFDDGLEAHDARIAGAAEEAEEHLANLRSWIGNGGFKPKNWRTMDRYLDRYHQLSEASAMLQGWH